MVALILEKGLAYMLLVVDLTRLRIKLRVVRCVPMGLQILGIPSSPGVYRCRLTCGSVRVDLLLIKHLHFLGLILIVSLRWWILTSSAIGVVSALAVHVLYSS